MMLEKFMDLGKYPKAVFVVILVILAMIPRGIQVFGEKSDDYISAHKRISQTVRLLTVLVLILAVWSIGYSQSWR